MDSTVKESPRPCGFTDADILSDFFTGVTQLAAQAQQRVSGKRHVINGSRCLAMAVEAGCRPKMAYSVAEVSRFTGIPRSTFYEEHKDGRIKWVIPKGNVKGALITVDEIDRWMEENCE